MLSYSPNHQMRGLPEKTVKFIYYLSTGLLTAMMLFSAYGLLILNDQAQQGFERLGFPGYVPFFLGIAKILGLLAIWTRICRPLIDWAYAGFLYVFLLAFGAHVAIADGGWGGSVAATFLLLVSYSALRLLESKPENDVV